MSFNCSVFRIKKIENLRIPVASLYKHDREDWHPKRKNYKDDVVIFHSNFENVFLKGKIESNILICDDIKCFGEGSGTFKGWILEEALKESTGELEAVLVWEGGDSITRLKVKDGEISEIEIEL